MSPRTHEAIDALHEERRGDIMDVALDAFVECGFEGTRMQEIADRCNQSYGLVYRYFPTKEAIFTRLVEAALAAAASLIQTLPPGSPPSAFGTFFSCAVADPSPKYFAIIVEALTKQGVPPALSSRVRETVLGFKDAIATAGRGTISGNADVWAEGMLALLLGASIMKICRLSDGNFANHSAIALAASASE